MKRKRNLKKNTRNKKNVKLSLFQKSDMKFARACPLSGKDAPVIEYKNIKVLRKYISESVSVIISKNDPYDVYDRFRQ